MIYIERYMLAVPDMTIIPTGKLEMLAGPAAKDTLEVYSGTKSIGQFGISVRGSGSWVTGSLKGKLTSMDYKALYEVYNLPTSESANYWFVTYSKNSSTSELKKVFEDAKAIDQDFDLKFEIQGNDFGISSVFITYDVIRLTIDGVSKDFIVNNANSAGANNQDGTKYNGGFKAV